MSQIVTKFIQNDAVTGTKIRLSNNETLRARNNANTANIDLFKLTTSDTLEIQSLPYVDSALPVPSLDKQLATVEYVKNQTSGKIDAKDACQYLADTNITGTFTGGTTNTLVGTTQLNIDGKAFTTTDVINPPIRIALTNQTAGLQNGIYELTSATASSYTLTRATDFSTDTVSSGAYFVVSLGTVYAGYEVILTTADPLTINTTALTFVKYPSTLSLTAGDMLTKVNNNFSVDLQSNGGLESSNPGNAGGQLRIKIDGSALEKDKSTAINSSGQIVARKSAKQTYTLTGTDITNQYVDLSFVAGDASISLGVVGGGFQAETTDYAVNYTGGTASKTRVTFAGGLATGGVSQLVTGDVVQVQYNYLAL
jgi:hypothetical protein